MHYPFTFSTISAEHIAPITSVKNFQNLLTEAVHFRYVRRPDHLSKPILPMIPNLFSATMTDLVSALHTPHATNHFPYPTGIWNSDMDLAFCDMNKFILSAYNKSLFTFLYPAYVCNSASWMAARLHTSRHYCPLYIMC